MSHVSFMKGGNGQMRLWGKSSPMEINLHKAGSLLCTKFRSHEPEHLCLENVGLLTRLVVFQGFEMFFLHLKYVSVFARYDARFWQFCT